MILPFAWVIERACKGVWLLAGQFASVNTRPGFQHSDVDELKSASPTVDDAVPATFHWNLLFSILVSGDFGRQAVGTDCNY